MGFLLPHEKVWVRPTCRNLRKMLDQNSAPKANDFMGALCQEGFLKFFTLRERFQGPQERQLEKRVFARNRPLVTTSVKPGNPLLLPEERRKGARYAAMRKQHSLRFSQLSNQGKPKP